MNKLFTKIAALALGAAMAFGVGVAVSSKNVSAANAAESTASMTSFSATSGNVGTDSNVTYAAYKGGGTSNPAINSSAIRLYQNAGDNTGGMLVVKAKSGYTISSITIKSTMATTVGVMAGVEKKDSESVAKTAVDESKPVSANTDVTFSGFSDSVVTMFCLGTTSSSRWYVSKLSVTYSDGDTPEEDSVTLSVSPSYLDLDLYDDDTGTLAVTITATGEYTNSFYVYSTDSSIADVNAYAGSGNTNITVTAYAVGTCQIVVGANDDVDVYEEIDVTVTDSTPVPGPDIPTGSGDWVETAITSLTSTDTFVIVGNNGSNYAMSNDNGTSAPSAVAVTVNNGKITSEVAESIMWNISSGTSPYTFYPASYTNKWLYTTSDNNGVKVGGTNDNKTFTIDSGYLKNTTTSRYVGIYNSADWRCYTTINANITGQTFKFYKFVSTYSVTKNATNCTIAGETSLDGSSNATYTITPSTNYNAPTSITVVRGSTTLTNQYTYTVSDNVGTLTIPAAQITGNFTITAAGIPTYAVTGTIAHGSLTVPGRIVSGGTLNVTFVPDSGYTYPESINDITVTGATKSNYNSSNGVLTLSNPTGAVSVSASCIAQGNTYSISVSVSNSGTYSGDTQITDNGGTASVSVSAGTGYKLPDSVTVTNANHTYTKTNKYQGSISLSNATGNVSITVACVKLSTYSITVNATNGSASGDESIVEDGSASITFTPNATYGQPSSVSVSGATSSWNRNSGVLSLSNPTGNVTVTYAAVGNELDSISISANSGSYTLGDDFVMPTVTAKYTVNPDADVTSSASYSGYDPFTTGNQAVTISYTEGGITKTASYTANVSAKSVGYSYNKISLVSDITEGDYILAYSSYAFNGKDANNGYTSVTITNDSIVQSAAMDKLALHITPVTGGYTLQVSSTSDDNPGKYLGFTSNTNSLTFNDNAVTIASQTVSSSTHYTHGSGGAFTFGDSSTVLSWNNNSSNYRYRFYKTGTTADSTNGKNYYAFDLYKKVSSGSSSLIRITATYTGGEKYVGDSISTSDFAVKKQLDTGNQLIDVASGYTINKNTLTSESNTVTVSYTENGVTKTFDVVVAATPRAVELVSINLVQGEDVVKEYVDWSGAEWDYTDLTVQRVWSDETVESLSLADLVSGGDATISPAKPSVGTTSFTVSYDYLEKSIQNGTVSGISVVTDYVESVSWTGKSLSHFKAFSGSQLTQTTVDNWVVKATYAGAGETNALTFGTGANQFTIRIGDSKSVTSLPYTWTSADDGEFIYVVVGGVAKGDGANAKANICTTINPIDHDETISGLIDKSTGWTTDQSSALSDQDFGTRDLDANISMTGVKSSGSTNVRIYSGTLRTYANNEMYFTPSNGAIIKTINLANITASECSDSQATHSGNVWTIKNGTGTITFTGLNKVTVNADIVVEYQINGSETTTVHYANDINHFDAQKKVVEFAKFMNTTMNGTNVCSGTFANLETAWDDVAGKYDELFGASTTLNETELAWAKNMLKYASAIWGSDAEAACVEKAMKTYEHCVAKYELEAFMSELRSVSKTSIINPIIDVNNNAPVLVTVIVSMIGLSAVGGYFFLRKRKENI